MFSLMNHSYDINNFPGIYIFFHFSAELLLKKVENAFKIVVMVFVFQLEFLHTEESSKPLGDSWIAKLLVFVHRECEYRAKIMNETKRVR